MSSTRPDEERQTHEQKQPLSFRKRLNPDRGEVDPKAEVASGREHGLGVLTHIHTLSWSITIYWHVGGNGRTHQGTRACIGKKTNEAVNLDTMGRKPKPKPKPSCGLWLKWTIWKQELGSFLFVWFFFSHKLRAINSTNLMISELKKKTNVPL